MHAHLVAGKPRNRFGAVRAPVPVVPLATAQPTAAVAPGLQTATIVGLQGEVLTPERNHQVKVQFAWQRNTTPAGVDVHMDQPIVVGQLYNGVDTPPFCCGCGLWHQPQRHPLRLAQPQPGG